MYKKSNSLENKGYFEMSKSSIVICSIVRDCNKALKRNIPLIENLRTKFKYSQIIVVENDSEDGTKETLLKWSASSLNVKVQCNNFSKTTIPKNDENGFNKYFSYQRISKMVSFRNQYMSLLTKSNIEFDFVMIIDLDIEKFSIDGIANSFGLSEQWDAVTSNGYSYSPLLKKRYHDSYSLIEVGCNAKVQTEDTIINNQNKWAFLKVGQPLIPVFSAFGGLAIYKFDTIKNKNYNILFNNDKRIQVKCEHFSLHQQMHDDGCNKIFINPNMIVKYQKIDFELIKKYMINKIIIR